MDDDEIISKLRELADIPQEMTAEERAAALRAYRNRVKPTTEGPP